MNTLSKTHFKLAECILELENVKSKVSLIRDRRNPILQHIKLLEEDISNLDAEKDAGEIAFIQADLDAKVKDLKAIDDSSGISISSIEEMEEIVEDLREFGNDVAFVSQELFEKSIKPMKQPQLRDYSEQLEKLFSVCFDFSTLISVAHGKVKTKTIQGKDFMVLEVAEFNRMFPGE